MAASRLSLQAVRQIWKSITSASSGQTFNRVLDKVNIVSVSPGRCQCELVVEKEHTNVQNKLHGSCLTAMVDSFTAVALVTSEVGKIGASVELDVSFIRSASLGEKIFLDAEVIKTGKSLAFMKANIFNSSGDLIARGKHTVFVGMEKSAQEKSFQKYIYQQ